MAQSYLLRSFAFAALLACGATAGWAAGEFAGYSGALKGAAGFDAFQLSRKELRISAHGKTQCQFALKSYHDNSSAAARTVVFAGRGKGCPAAKGHEIYGYLNLDRPDAPGAFNFFEKGKQVFELQVASVRKEAGQ